MEISNSRPNRLHTIEYLHCDLLWENCFAGNTVIVGLYWALLLLPWYSHGPVIGLYFNFVFCMLCKWVVFLPLVNSCNIVINSRSLPHPPVTFHNQRAKDMFELCKRGANRCRTVLCAFRKTTNMLIYQSIMLARANRNQISSHWLYKIICSCIPLTRGT